jgi:hypothetical protein
MAVGGGLGERVEVDGEEWGECVVRMERRLSGKKNDNIITAVKKK